MYGDTGASGVIPTTKINFVDVATYSKFKTTKDLFKTHCELVLKTMSD
jgi:hypothetical protein